MAGTAVYKERVEAIISAMCAEEGVRVPGDRREQKVRLAQERGLEISEAVLATVRKLTRA